MFWLLAQATTLISGLIFFHNIAHDNGLGQWPVQRAIIFNAAAYLLWAVFGFGLGTLIRNQIGTVVTGMAIYLIGYVGGIGFFVLIRTYLIHGDWVLTSAVIDAVDRLAGHDLAGQALPAVGRLVGRRAGDDRLVAARRHDRSVADPPARHLLID